MSTQPARRKRASPKDDDSDITVVSSSIASETSENQTILLLARERFRVVTEAESILRQEQLIDKRFSAGDQWDEKTRAKRKRQQRPCLTVNRIPQFTKQITGRMQANRQDIQVFPVDDSSDPKTADVFSGIIKHIEAISHAEVALDTAAQDQVIMGRGYFRLITEWARDDSNDQDIKIKRIRNAHSVYYDPRCVEPDYSDAQYAFVVTDYSEEEFKRAFPTVDHTYIDEDSFDALGDAKALWWLTNNTIRVAEYFYVDFEQQDVVRLSDGRDMFLDKAEPLIEKSTQNLKAMLDYLEHAAARGQALDVSIIPEPLSIVKQRKGQRRTIRCCKINGVQILEKQVWPGRWIPIIPILGDEIDLDGRVDLRGIVRDSRDQQRLYNFHVSSLVETIAMAPRAPWVIAKGQIQGYEKIWKSANQESHAYLPYHAISSNGTFAPPPQRQTFEPAIQAIVVAIHQADNDFKATTGFYDASLGQRGPDESGTAIMARQKQGETGSIHFMTGMRRAQWCLGRQLVDLIPKIMDVPRVLRILGPSDEQQAVMVHAGNAHQIPEGPDGKPQLPEGVKQVFDLDVGRYDIVIGSGPSTDTRRQESVMMMTEAIKGNPALMQLIGDLYFGSMDDPKMRKIAERLKKVLPPNLQDDNGELDPEKLKAQVSQLQQQLHEAGGLLQEAQQKIAAKTVEQQGKLAITQTQIAATSEEKAKDREKDLAVAELTAKVDKMALFFEERARLGAQAHDAGMAAVTDHHEASMAHLNAQHDRETLQLNQQHERQVQAAQQQSDAQQAGSAQQADSAEADAQREHEADQATQGRDAEAGEADAQREHDAEQATQAQGATADQATQAQTAAAKQAKATAAAKPKPAAKKK